MRVVAAPARRNRDRNPFNFLLSEALAAEGCEVDDFDDRDGLLTNADILHIHWPQEAARGRRRRALVKTVNLLLPLLAQRLKGTRIVWTVHNVRGHDQNNAGLEKILMRVVARLVHGVIFLTESSRDPAYAEIPALAAKPFAVIPHGLYGSRSERTRDQARALFGLPVGTPVIGFLGDIKRYKGLDLLLDAFAETPPGEITLFIAGEFPSPSYRAEVENRLAGLRTGGHAVVFHEKRLDTQALIDAIRSCNVVALPYRTAWNSGLALLVLENGVRILTSDAPVFRDLQHEVGREWVETYDGNPTGKVLMSAAADAAGEGDMCKCGFSEARSWTRIGAETLAFYRRLGAR